MQDGDIINIDVTVYLNVYSVLILWDHFLSNIFSFHIFKKNGNSHRFIY